jgi:hypothetical protein
MKINEKKLTTLLRFIEVAIILTGVSLIFVVFYAVPKAEKFNDFSKRLPDFGGFDSLRQALKLVTYAMAFKVIAIRVFYLVILLNIRKILKSILNGELFQAEQAKTIRIIAIYFLCFAGALIFLNLLLMFTAITKDNHQALMSAIANLVSIFENYLLTGLIGFAIAEAFILGAKLKQEQDLTI